MVAPESTALLIRCSSFNQPSQQHYNFSDEKLTPKSTAKHEEIIKIVNGNVRQSEHTEKTANAIRILAYVSLILLAIGVDYMIYKAIIKHERLKTLQARSDSKCDIREVNAGKVIFSVKH